MSALPKPGCAAVGCMHQASGSPCSPVLSGRTALVQAQQHAQQRQQQLAEQQQAAAAALPNGSTPAARVQPPEAAQPSVAATAAAVPKGHRTPLPASPAKSIDWQVCTSACAGVLSEVVTVTAESEIVGPHLKV